MYKTPTAVSGAQKFITSTNLFSFSKTYTSMVGLKANANLMDDFYRGVRRSLDLEKGILYLFLVLPLSNIISH